MPTQTHQVLVIAHRGSMSEAPENTMAAFRLALEQNSDAIELDIHLSKDNQIIVCHDATVDRTTNGTGAIRNMTVTELKQLDAGSWFDTSFAGERLPLLDEVFQLVPDSVLLNIEVKNKYGDHLYEPLLNLINKYNRLQSVVISSYDHKCLKSLKLREPGLNIGLLTSCNMIDLQQYIGLMGVDVYSVHPNYKQIDPEDIKAAVDNNIQIFPYTINSEEHLQAAIDSGVTGIITNYPARLNNLM